MFAIKIVCTIILLTQSCLSDYWKDRDEFIKQEESEMLGSSIILTTKEEEANRILMAHKLRELDAGFANPAQFNPARHFFEARDDIEASQIYKIIQKMPKGGALHGHDVFVVSQEYFMNLTYKDNLYGCKINHELYLKFLGTIPDNCCNWTLVSQLRRSDPDFDKYVQSQFFLNVENPRQKYQDINTIWKKMTKIGGKLAIFLGYKDVFQEQFYQTLTELYNDNVKYYEFRSFFPRVYDLSGRFYNAVEIAGFYQDTIELFKRNHPDFIGARLIYTMSRKNEVDEAAIKTLIELHELYPNLLAGLDICGQEDKGKSLEHYAGQIEKIPNSIKRFFHAAESNWFGATDNNLIDAILLNVTRIGHGFGVTKHPLVMKIIKQRNIALEVCPISNQVLMLVDDLRNHPAVSLMAQGYPVVLGHDDNTLWGSNGLSDDFYMAFLGMTSRNTDLRFLKQLALNSLEYSSLPALAKERAIRLWQNDWDSFVHKLVDEELLLKTSFDEN